MFKINLISFLVILSINVNRQTKSIKASKNEYEIKEYETSIIYSNKKNRISDGNIFYSKYTDDIIQQGEYYFNFKESSENIKKDLRANLQIATLAKLRNSNLFGAYLYLNKKGKVVEVKHLLLRKLDFSANEVELIEAVLLKQTINARKGEKFKNQEKLKYFPLSYNFKTLDL